MFSRDYQKAWDQLAVFDPIEYARSRNYVDGAVSKLSPYISRGVFSTKMVMQEVLKQGHTPHQSEKYFQELAWRDYWQQVWIAKGDFINEDLRREQPAFDHYEMPASIISASTGIQAVDKAIQDFYNHGYLHNHVRMYIATMACNFGRSHWRTPAKWMYYHLIDADWASNALSWQWVAGANANKKYYANQSNINKYCRTHQKGTFLDVSYDDFEDLSLPAELFQRTTPQLVTPLPTASPISLDSAKPTLIYNYYNLDPNWKKDLDANRVLLLEPSTFAQYPISKSGIDFMLDLSKNIPGIVVYVGEFGTLLEQNPSVAIYYKEHPLNNNYRGIEEPRDWMFTTKGYFPSFFAFWKKCRKELYA